MDTAIRFCYCFVFSAESSFRTSESTVNTELSLSVWFLSDKQEG